MRLNRGCVSILENLSECKQAYFLGLALPHSNTPRVTTCYMLRVITAAHNYCCASCMLRVLHAAGNSHCSIRHLPVGYLAAASRCSVRSFKSSL
jgi:hypothetical protein